MPEPSVVAGPPVMGFGTADGLAATATPRRSGCGEARPVPSLPEDSAGYEREEEAVCQMNAAAFGRHSVGPRRRKQELSSTPTIAPRPRAAAVTRASSQVSKYTRPDLAATWSSNPSMRGPRAG